MRDPFAVSPTVRPALRFSTWLLLITCVMACSTPYRVPAEASTAKATEAEPAATTKAAYRDAAGCGLLDAHGLEATFLLYRPVEKSFVACDPVRAGQRFLPASTFKIANALIGLETGAVRDEREVTPWDGMTRAVPAWNQDADLASGMRNSTVWFYQAMARRIGAQRMRAWVGTLRYGNADIGPDAEVAHFWLNGALRISAREEVDFVDRLRRRALPLSERSQATVIRILEVDRSAEGADPAWVLRGKTGAALPIDPKTGDMLQGAAADKILHGAEPVGWFVGWVERDAADGGDAVFAFNLKLRSNADLPLRVQLVRKLLAANGVLPARE